MIHCRHQGFTLVELIVTMTFTAVVLLVIFQLAVLAIDVQVGRTSAAAVTNEASLATFRLNREARALRAVTDVVVASVAEFRFIVVGGTNVRYWRSGTNLMRNDQVLAEGVTSLSFAYVDSAGATIVTPLVSPTATDVRLVEMTMTVASNDGRAVSYRTAVRFRNAL